MSPNARVAATVTNINVYFHLISPGEWLTLRLLSMSNVLCVISLNC